MNTEAAGKDFIRQIIATDVGAGKNAGQVITRFPPEPNGFLHIGHAKAICLNFNVAQEFGGRCHLRFDDTNPVKEEALYADAIRDDVAWLGFTWGENEFYASDYFEDLYHMALKLIEAGLAYIDDLNGEQIRALRGTLTEPGQNSPHRDRSVKENLELFQRMRAGEFGNGERVLRAKIDMSSPNMNMRDPIMYRILHAPHHRTGGTWCIYPMYDFAHGQSDALEGITHSLCTLEFADHRPLYDWFIEKLDLHQSRQYEYSRLNLGYTVLSKRKLQELVSNGAVSGWDDPRMPTLAGMRRRGFPPQSLRKFCARIGISKNDSWIDMSVLEDCVREELNETAPRAMCVLRPLKVVITDYPEGKQEEFVAPNHPQQPEMGERNIQFTRELFIEQDDFMLEPPSKFFRLGPGREVRLRNGYVIKCEEVVYNDDGSIKELHCSHDPATLGAAPEGRKVKGVIHWISAAHAVKIRVHLYDRLFQVETPGAGEHAENWLEDLNPDSIETLEGCLAEPCVCEATPAQAYQFERCGYFCLDAQQSTVELPVFNRTVTLRDSWSKANK
ncbi:MAG: glutamine--tRNA ligase/YqeY domain fusion protein [Desulfuromonadaceae bacterium]|nr:glutamine--tRNA ligase/YqeY domain fusion protein [Desulfuromonadaceae bacterium]